MIPFTTSLVAAAAATALAQPATTDPDPAEPRPAGAVIDIDATEDATNAPSGQPADGAPARRSPFPIIRFSADTYSLFRSSADLDNTSNSYSVAASEAGVNALIITSPALTFSVGFSSEFSFYEFNGDEPLIEGVPGSNRPFTSAQRHRISLTTIIRTSEQMTWLAGGAINATYEPGADLGDSIGGSVLGGFSYALSETLSLGLGLNVVFDLDGQPNILPLPFVDWTFAERWRLASDSRGITLSFEHSETLSYGLGARFLGREFRLDDDGPIPGGLAQDDAIAIAAVVEWNITENLFLDIAAGVQPFNEFELRNADDVVIFREDGDPAFAGALRLRYSF